MNKKHIKFPTTYTSMTHASARLGVPIERIRAAKRLGAPGFAPNGRVIGSLLVGWLKEHASEVDAFLARPSIAERKMEEQVRRLRRENDMAEASMVRRDLLQAALARVRERAKEITHAHLERWASAVPVMDVPAARAWGASVEGDLLRDIGALASEFEKWDSSSDILDTRG